MTTANRLGQRLVNLRDDFLRRSLFVTAIRVVGLLCVFALQVLLARLVGDTTEYGNYAWGQSLLFLAGALASLGLPAVTGRFVAALSVNQNERAIAAVIGRAISLLIRSSLALACIALLLMIFWHNPSGAHSYRDIAVLALLLAPAVSFSNLYQSLSRARRWLGLSLLPFFVLRPVATGILALSFWSLFRGHLSGEIALGLAGVGFVAVVIAQALRYHQREKQLPAVVHAPEAALDYDPSRLFRTALPMFFTHCAVLTINYANVLLVGFLAGPAAAGAYFAAERLAQLAAIPLAVVGAVNQQPMAAAHASKNTTGLQRITTQSAHGSLWPTLVVSIALVTLATPLLHLFGDDFSSARTVLIVLVASSVINVLTGPASDVLVMSGHQRHIPTVMFVSAAAHVAVLFLLVPTFGAPGAAFASIASGLVANVWLMELARREAGIGTTVLGIRNK
jgi:O-antigen/teichoic acid export membrane protein